MRNLWRSSFLFIALIVSCSRPNENCLDINATNYDVTAEVQCETCCNYPNLTINFSAIFQGEPLSLNQFIYENDFGETYGIVSGRFILSNFLLIDSEGNDFRIRDSLLLSTTGSDSLYFRKDFVYISELANRTYTMGLFPVQNEYRKIGFNLGLSGDACSINLFEVPDNENLGRGLRGLFDPDTPPDSLMYFSARIEVLVDTSEASMQTKILYLPLCDIDMRNELETFIGGTSGFDLAIPLRLDLNEVLKNIQFSTLDSLNILPEWREDFVSGLYIE